MGEPWFSAAFGEHYPLLYAHRDESEARRCLELLPRLAPLSLPHSMLPVLDLGCGDGRHLGFVASLVPSVLGLDLSNSLLGIARDRRLEGGPGHILGLLRGDMRKLPLASGTCGGVLSLFTSFGYFGKLESNSVVVKEVARVLTDGGCWFLDYLDCDRVRSELSSQPEIDQRIRQLGPCRFVERRRLSPDGRLVSKDVDVTALPGQEAAAGRYGIRGQGLHYTEQVALFSLVEIDALAATYGLQRKAGVGSYDGSALGSGDRWLLVYEKSSLANKGDQGG